MISERPLRGVVMVVTSSIGFGLLPVFTRALGGAGVSIPTMLAARFGVGALCLWAFALIRRERLHIARREVLACLALGTLYVSESWFYVASANRLPAALTAMLLYTFPAFVAVVNAVVWKQRLTPMSIVGLVCALLGTSLALGTPERMPNGVGVILGLSCAISYAGYVLANERVTIQTTPFVRAAWIMSAAAVLFGLAALVSGEALSIPRASLSDLLKLGLLCTAIPIPLMLLGIEALGATRASIVATVEPIVAGIAGAIYLSERLETHQLIGGALVLTAVVLMSLSPRAARETA